MVEEFWDQQRKRVHVLGILHSNSYGTSVPHGHQLPLAVDLLALLKKLKSAHFQGGVLASLLSSGKSDRSLWRRSLGYGGEVSLCTVLMGL